MVVTWIALAALGVLCAWLTKTVLRLRERLVMSEGVLNQYSTNFNSFMEVKVVELQRQVALNLERIKQEADRKIDEAAKTIDQEVKQNGTKVLDRVQVLTTKAREQFEKQFTDFQVLMKNAYLEEYEKMKRNPPRPKKGPRKQVDPPSAYRSLDDE